jgi:hypothetical protein
MNRAIATRVWVRTRQPTVLGMIGPNRAAAFNRGRGRPCILNARIYKLFQQYTTTLLLKELREHEDTALKHE